MPPSLSVIMPTQGRETIKRTIASILSQPLAPDDEVLIVADGPARQVKEWIAPLGKAWQYIETVPTNNWGNPQRNRGLVHAQGDLIVWMDDDDIFAPGAFATIRERAAGNPGQPLMFRFRYEPTGRLIWDEKGLIACGAIGGHCFVTPNVPEMLGQWSSRYEGDYDFIVSTLIQYPDKDDAIVWCEEVIAQCRPETPIPETIAA